MLNYVGSVNRFLQRSLLCSVLMLFVTVSHAGNFTCEFSISSQWDTGASASLSITNTSAAALQWQQITATFPADANIKIQSAWNASFSGSNPYTFKPYGWNEILQPGQSVQIGMQLAKTAAGAFPLAALSGDCGSANQAPVAAIDIRMMESLVTLDGRNSHDPDGDTLTYSWTVNGAPRGTGSVLGSMFFAKGTYTVGLTVSDGELSNSATKTFTQSYPPVYDPIAAFSYVINNYSVSFDGSKSRAIGIIGVSIYSYEWSFGDGTRSNEIKPVHQYTADGIYLATLTVVDSNLRSSSITKTIIVGDVPNQAPVAALTLTQNPEFNHIVTLDGRESYDPDKHTLEYIWTINGVRSFYEGPFIESAPFNRGINTVELTVTDGRLSDSASGTVEVVLPPEPLADFTFVASGTRVDFDGSLSEAVSPNETIESYQWNFGDGSWDYTMSPTHQYAAPGVYEVTLYVRDTLHISGSKTIQITVADDTTNSAPTAVLKLSGFEALVTMDGRDSSDPDGDTLSYQWTIDGRVLPDTVAYIGSYAVGRGTHTIELTVSDGQLSHSVSETITINYPPAPVARFTFAVDASSVVFDASTSFASAIGATIYSYQWDFGDGTFGNGVAPQHNYAEAGTYTVVLTVNDSYMTSAQKSSTVTIDAIDTIDEVSCTYQISSEWGNNFEANIVISNTGATAINGWSINVTYPDNTSVNSVWNASVSGANPFILSNVGWNGVIQPGASVQIGFIGTKGSATASTPELSGATCAL